jgi:2-polyprenyl-3-methyl-5-hydroxy-6-metoxy-1,4-benzoquinol methylase
MRLWHRVIHPISSHFRRRRGRVLLERFPQIRNYKICDLGGSRHFWEKLGLDIPESNITIFNISDDETATVHEATKDKIEIVIYDGKRIPVEDRKFDLCICNSVIEHVSPQDRKQLVAEMRRVAKRVFCQTPAYEFPIEPHFLMPFIHWLPRRIGFWLAKISVWRVLSKPSSATITRYWWGTNLLRRSEICRFFPDEEILEERVLGFCKSYYVVSV